MLQNNVLANTFRACAVHIGFSGTDRVVTRMTEELFRQSHCIRPLMQVYYIKFAGA